VQIRDNLYSYIWQGRGNNCNTCLFTDLLRGNRPHVIVDPGFVTDELGESCLDSLIASIEGDGFKAEDIGLIINTHSHPDHCDANQALVQKTRREAGIKQALIAINQEEDEYRCTIGEKIYSLMGRKPPQIEPFFYLGEGDLVLGGRKGIKLQILHTPGHSPGSISLYWPDNKVLISGDVIFYGSVGRTDFPGGSLSTLKQSIEKLSKLEVECMIPGHSTEFGGIIQGKERVERNFQAIRLLF
jgi:glyoxylase-like metal-dependent hydrolase (beta-lactamase superfamily II)